jgi:hypothetical protein
VGAPAPGNAPALASKFGPIREALDRFPLDTIAHAIGVSRTAAGYIRSGKQVPHVRHWSALVWLAGVPDPLSAEGPMSIYTAPGHTARASCRSSLTC